MAIAHHAGRSGYRQLAEHLPAASARVEVLHPGPLPRWLPRGVATRLVARARPRWYRDETLGMEIALARRRPADVVHMLDGDETLWYWASAARRGGPKLVCTFHQPPKVLEEVGPGLRRLRRIDAAVALAHNQADYFAEHLGQDRVIRSLHGVDTAWWRPGDGPRDDATCLFVGQWLRDVETLRAVAAQLAQRAPDVRVRAAGVSPEAAEVLRDAPNVTLLPRLTDEELRDEYRSASLLLLPLADATANCAMLEAIGCGTPVVVSDVGGTRSYVDESSAVLTPPEDADAMTEAVLDLLQDGERRAELSAAARRRALHLDWHRVAGRLAAIYRDVAR